MRFQSLVAGGLAGVMAVCATACAGTSRTAAVQAAELPRATSRSVSSGGCRGVSVGPARTVVDTATAKRLGLDIWPDTALGVIRDGDDRYRFLATGTPGGRPPQQVVVTSGTLSDPVAGGVVSKRPVTNVPVGYDYAGGGPIYRDPASGLVLETLHLERPYGDDPGQFYTELHLGRFDPATGSVTRLGAIVSPHASFELAGRSKTTIDIGVSSLSVVTVGSTKYLYVYFPDASADASGKIAFSGLSVARAPLDDVLGAAKVGQVTAWSKYAGGGWEQPGLGGDSSDLSPGQPMAWHPDVARDASLSIMVAGVSPREMVLADSADGVTGWSAQHPLFRDTAYYDAYPTVVGSGSDPAQPGNAFFVYYTQWQSSSPDWSKARLMRRSVTCTEGLTAAKVPFVRYSDGSRHQVTTGPAAGPGYREEARWNLLTAQTPGTIPLYGCLNGATDHYVSTDAGCGGTQYSILQTEGWIYTDPPEAPSTALYRCYIRSLGDHFVSTRSDCEAPGNPDVAPEGRLGYALT